VVNLGFDVFPFSHNSISVVILSYLWILFFSAVDSELSGTHFCDMRLFSDGQDAVYQMAVLGSCQCDVAGSGPCACAQLTAQLMCDIALLNDQV